MRKNKRRQMEWRDLYASDDSDAETVDEDVITIKLELKRGDDVVQSLLDLWTPHIQVKGKEKEKVRKTAFGVVG